MKGTLRKSKTGSWDVEFIDGDAVRRIPLHPDDAGTVLAKEGSAIEFIQVNYYGLNPSKNPQEPRELDNFKVAKIGS
jgi:hypothetical protein